jgi:hypothetical protein
MDPSLAINLGLSILDAVIGEINKVRAQAGLTGDELAALADTQDLANAAAIKALLNPTS